MLIFTHTTIYEAISERINPFSMWQSLYLEEKVTSYSMLNKLGNLILPTVLLDVRAILAGWAQMWGAKSAGIICGLGWEKWRNNTGRGGMIHTPQSLPWERAVTDNIVRKTACFVERRNTYVIMVKKSCGRLRHRREQNIVKYFNK